jgi:N-acetylmuramoyl-L-alanine amidase
MAAMKTIYQHVIWVVMAGFLSAGIADDAHAKQGLFEIYKRVVAIDPGHGGDESGARGPAGATEKEITLNLAQILTTELQREYRVVATRTDDTRVSVAERTALANHNKADVLISLHTGASFAHGTSGVIVYHYQDVASDSRQPVEDRPILKPAENTPLLWDRAQQQHLAKSRALASRLNDHFNGADFIGESRVQAAPVLVLQGANMPAILIEIGYLTNPAEEKKLTDQRFLINLAQAIRRAVDEFFERNP